MSKITAVHENVERARRELVRRYRASPNVWPDGIDSKGDRWYRPEEWNDDGIRIAGKPYDGKPRKPGEAKP
jgi:hypothetical protein